MNNEIIISNIAPQDIIIEGGGSTIGLTAVYVNGVNVTVGSVAYVIVPTKLSELENNVGYITSETDPTVPTYIKQITMSDITSWNNKQNLLVSGTNIKTINNNSILGSGNLDISTSYTAGTGIEITEENVINNSITSYNDLTDRPTIPTHTSDLINNSNFVNGNSLSQVAYTGDYYDLIGKPDLSEYITKYVDNLVNYYTKDFMYGLLPKVSDEDTSITLNNTYPSELKLSLNPSELEQETTTGKNMLDENYYNNSSLYNGDSRYFAYVKLPDTFKTKFYGNMTLKGTSQNLVFAFSTITNGSSNTRMLDNGTLNANIEYDFTNAENVYIVIGNSNYVNITTDIPKIFNNYNIMVSKTSGDTYEPYTGGIASPNPQYPQDIHTISGDNTILIRNQDFFITDNVNTTKNGTTLTIENGNISIKNTPSSATDIINISLKVPYTIKSGDYLHFRNNRTDNCSIFLFYSNGTQSNPGLNAVNRIYDLSANVGKTIISIGVNIQTTFSGALTTFSPVILQSSSVVDYKENEYSTYSINLGDLEYSAIGNYKDEFYKATDSDTGLVSGKWYLKKNIGKVVLDGTNYSFSQFDNNANNRGLINLDNAKIVSFSTQLSLCSHFNFDSGVYADAQDNVGYCSRNNNAGIFIRFGSSSEVNTKALANTWLSENLPILYYALATPTYTLLNDTLQEQLEYIYNQMLSYKGQTSISQQNNDLPFNIVATTLKNISSL